MAVVLIRAASSVAIDHATPGTSSTAAVCKYERDSLGKSAPLCTT